MIKKILLILILCIANFLSCKHENKLDPENFIYSWSSIKSTTDLSKKQIKKNYRKQIKILEGIDRFYFFGTYYNKVKETSFGDKKKRNAQLITPLFSSSRNLSYYKFLHGIYFKREYEYNKIKTRFYKFYLFNSQKYEFEYKNKKILVPHDGPGSMGAEYSGITSNYIDDKYFWYSSFDTKQFQWWGFDNKYIDTFNMNVDNKYFYISRTFLMLPKYKQKDLLITPNFVVGSFLKSNKWWLDKPLLYKIDMYDSTYSRIDLDFKIEDEHNYIAAIDNGYTEKETIILMGTEPVILFLNDDYKIIKEIDLKRVYKKHGLEHLYEDYKLTQPWGKVFNVSDEHLLIMSPLFHFSDYNKISLDGVDNSKVYHKKIAKITDLKEVGDRNDVRKRLAILINKRTKKVEKSKIVELPVFSHYYYFFGPFLDIDYYVLKDMKYIIINLSYTKQLRRLEDFKDRKWENYYYVYKRVDK
ncbi:MAG TPA: hypothetical protein VKN74_07855 [Candidatus Mcinerneyibacterium sp.]|nr:hypothetical protein [Candidatus Mcinerneyibacterium sp.]